MPTAIEPAEHPPVRLGDRFEILPGEPVAEFRSPDAAAFGAIDRHHPSEPCFALVCEPGVPPRMPLIEPLRALRGDALLQLHDGGVVEWPPRERRCFVLVFERPESRVCASLAADFAPVSEEDILTNVLPPAVAALRSLFENSLTHRGVRPTNLFRRAGDPRIVLGECVSGPPGAAQPLVCETIESGLSLPAGRGAGLPGADLYALGVTIVLLLRGADPTRDMTADELVAAKISRGSFAVLMGGGATPLKLIEAIRGLLADDPRERWTLPDLEAWLTGKHVIGRQFPAPRRAVRPLEFGGAAYVTARTLAQGLIAGGAPAAKPIRSGEIESWVQRALADPDRATAFGAALADAGDSDGGQRDARLVARVAIALDPAAPIRHFAFAAMIDGIGPALAAAFAAGTGAPPIADAIMARLPHFWLAQQGALRPEQAQAIKLFDRMRAVVDDRRPAFGLPRLLYELNSGMHCLAPSIERDHVLDAAELLPALERAAAAGRLGEQVIDRHLAAFIAVRSKTLTPEWLDEIADSSPAARTLGTLKVLAHLQGLTGPDTAPALGARLAHDLPVLIERYHSRSRRARITAALDKRSERGNFADILAIVEAPAELQLDGAEFRIACREHAEIVQDLGLLRAAAEQRPLLAAELGGQIGAVAAGALATAVICASLFLV